MRRLLPVLIVLSLLALACSSNDPSLVATDAPSPTAADPTSSPEPITGESEADVSEATDGAAEESVEAQADGTDNPPAEPSPEVAPSPTLAGTQDGRPEPAAQPGAPGAGSGCRSDLAGEPLSMLSSRADIDGDSFSDTVTTYAIEARSGEPEWRLRVETAAGGTLDSPLRLEVGFNGSPVPLGGADVDGDGSTDELFTVVGASASADIVAIHAVDGCDLVHAHQNDYPVTFAVGGTVGNLAGLQCVDTDANGVNNGIVAWTGEADFGVDGSWQLFGTEYVLRGTELTEVGSRNLEANIREADFVYGQLTCGAVIL